MSGTLRFNLFDQRIFKPTRSFGCMTGTFHGTLVSLHVYSEVISKSHFLTPLAQNSIEIHSYTLTGSLKGEGKLKNKGNSVDNKQEGTFRL